MSILSRLFGGGNHDNDNDNGLPEPRPPDSMCWCGGCQRYLSHAEYDSHDCLPNFDYSQYVCWHCGKVCPTGTYECDDCGGKRFMHNP